MATRKIPLAVPAFSAREIILAELCALDLWEGINFQTGKPIVSDEDLLIAFSHPTYAITNKGSTSQSISVYDVERLVEVAKLGQMRRGKTPTNYQIGINNFSISVLPIYWTWINQPPRTPGHINATRAILNWSPTFTGINQITQARGRHRIALCSRIIFFALPELSFFNFSGALAKKLGLQSSAENALPSFNEILEIGYDLNRQNLAVIQMPTSTRLYEGIRSNALKSDWWGRRVLDIALLLHFGISHARPPLQQKMREIALTRGV